MNPQTAFTYPFGHVIPMISTSRRRKIRKGTFSCWECKNRKIRCQINLGSDVCDSCQRHGTDCISQEFEEHPDEELEEVDERISQVEEIVEKLIRQREILRPRSRRAITTQIDGNNSTQPDNGGDSAQTSENNGARGQGVPSITSTPSPLTKGLLPRTVVSLSAPVLATAGADVVEKCKALTTYLYSVLPHPGTAALIVARGKVPFEVLRQSPTISESAQGHETQSPYAWTPQVVDTEKPILLARRLTQLAICLQQLEMTSIEESELQLNEPAGAAAGRFVDIARQVTSQDALVKSLAGLEALILEACYLGNLGNFKAAWLVNRRAMSIAQAIGFPEMADKVGSRAEFIWFRLLFIDWHYCLVSGLPSGSDDRTFIKPEHLDAAQSTGKQERLHVSVAGLIIMRNVQLQRLQQSSKDTSALRNILEDSDEIERDLEHAKTCLPKSWWEMPTMQQMAADNETKEQTARLLTQLHQNYLLILLQQPYLICYNSSILGNDIGNISRSADPSPYSSSDQRLRCLMKTADAAIEVLSRYLLFRYCNILKAAYASLDRKADTAAVALMLAHIEGHRLRTNPISQRRTFDLNMLEQAVRTMEGIEYSRNDPTDGEPAFSHKPKVLRKLMRLECQAARGMRFIVGSGSLLTDEDRRAVDVNGVGVSFALPYFGTVIVRRQERSLSMPENGKLAKKARTENAGPADLHKSHRSQLNSRYDSTHEHVPRDQTDWCDSDMWSTMLGSTYANPTWPETFAGDSSGLLPFSETAPGASNDENVQAEATEYLDSDDISQLFHAWLQGETRLEDIYSDINANAEIPKGSLTKQHY